MNLLPTSVVLADAFAKPQSNGWIHKIRGRIPVKLKQMEKNPACYVVEDTNKKFVVIYNWLLKKIFIYTGEAKSLAMGEIPAYAYAGKGKRVEMDLPAHSEFTYTNLGVMLADAYPDLDF